MEEELINFFKNHKYGYPKSNIDSIEKIYNLFINNILFDPKTGNEFHFMGLYYAINENYDKMKECYLIAIEKENIISMIALGSYYQIRIKNYDKMKKYYLMAIDKENDLAMRNL